MPTISELIEQAESLLKKKIAIKESVPGVFESMANVDDQLRITINQIVASGQDGELTSTQINLVNTALVGTRSAIASYQTSYRPTVNDLVAEFAILPQVNLRNLKNLKDNDPKLYDSLVKTYGVITETDFSKDLGGDDMIFLQNKEAVYQLLNDAGFNGSYIDDNVWSYFVSQARGKNNALWGNLSTAAKFLQENYGFEFSVKYLENPQ